MGRGSVELEVIKEYFKSILNRPTLGLALKNRAPFDNSVITAA